MTDVVAIVGDLHIGSRVGLCVPSFALEGGGTYRASPAQRQIWRLWVRYWKEVARTRKANSNARLIVVLNGELADINRHSLTDPISRNPSEVLLLSARALAPAMDLSPDLIFVTRGTEAHSGVESYRDEIVGRDLESVTDSEGRHAWSRLRAVFGGVQFDIAHHPERNSRVPYFGPGAAGRIIRDVIYQYNRRDQRAPDVIVRGHVHEPKAAEVDRHAAYVAPGWKLPDAFTARIAGDELPVGGLIFTCNDGSYSVTKWYRWRTAKMAIWRS